MGIDDMAKCLRVLSALPEDLHLALSTHIGDHNNLLLQLQEIPCHFLDSVGIVMKKIYRHKSR